MKITDYAVYKDDKTPWTVEEVKLISYSMGDTNARFATLNYPDMKFVYIDTGGDVYNWYSQEIDNKIKISYTDYLKLVTPTVDNIKIGSKILIVDNFKLGSYQSPEGEMDDYLGKVVTIKTISKPYFKIAEDGEVWHWYLPSFKCLVLPDIEQPTNLCLQLSRQTGKSIAIDSMMKLQDLLKQEKPVTPFETLFGFKPSRKGKYLSLKIKNGQANVRSLIYQAEATGIEDPRPYIQSLIAAEVKRLKQTVAALDLSTIQYGFNIKLASLIAFATSLQQAIYNNPDTDIDLDDCTNIYTLLDELAILQSRQQADIDLGVIHIDPYQWIKSYLTPAVLNIPKAKTLFVSNKFHIYIKDGHVYFEEVKAGILYKAVIKLDVTSNTYYI